MTRSRMSILILLAGLFVGATVITSSQNQQPFGSPIVTVAPDVTLTLPPFTEKGVLPQDFLMQRALMVARDRGLTTPLRVADLDAASSVLTTFREWNRFTDGDVDPEPGDLGAENADRPVFVMQIAGDGLRPLASHPLPPGTDATPVRYGRILILLYADTGEWLMSGYRPAGEASFDLTGLKRYADMAATPVPDGLIPLPPAP